MCRIHLEHLYTLPLICFDRLKMASIEVKQMSSSCKTQMHVTVSVYEKYTNQCLRICLYIRSTLGVLRVFMTPKWAAHACRKNLWMPATINWWLFAHFRSRKRRVGHRVLFRSERIVLMLSFKECNVLLRSFFEFLATYETQKNDAFFCVLFLRT